MTSLPHLPRLKPQVVVDNTREKPLHAANLDASELLSHCLAQELPDSGVVLELNSNSGERGASISRLLPLLKWQPSQLSSCVAAIQLWRDAHQNSNILPPVILDVATSWWPIKQVDAVFSADLVQAMGLAPMRQMLEGIAFALKQTGVAIFYGRFHDLMQGDANSSSCYENEANAESRKAHDTTAFESFLLAARRQHLRLLKEIVMPADNRLLVFQKG